MRKGRTDMSDYSGIVRMVTSVVLQFREKRFDLSLHVSTTRARPTGNDGRIEPMLQFH